MPIAKTFGYGASAMNYCCPTEELVRPSITGKTVENQCDACYTTTLSNCGNYGEYLFTSYYWKFPFETRWFSDGVSAVNENLSKNTGTNSGTNTGTNTGTKTETTGDNSGSNIDTNTAETAENGSFSAETQTLTMVIGASVLLFLTWKTFNKVSGLKKCYVKKKS